MKYKYILKVNKHDYYDTAYLALKAARKLEEGIYTDTIIRYDDAVSFYAKKNKASITVRQLDE